MQARFLLGPAGIGKTFRCLHEIASKLRAEPDGPDLILVAPKQATFQLERQLLNDFDLPGYTRLQILSFERLASYVLTKLNAPVLEMLSEEGRVMVLRALLRESKGLKVFHSSASMSGFARQLSDELRELQRHQLSPAKLRELAEKAALPEVLRRKLHDLAVLLDGYTQWLATHQLRDVDSLIGMAAEELSQASTSVRLNIEGLWLDGFAEMTPQELSLLTAIAPHCDEMTLAFCLDREQARENKSWLSIWHSIQETFNRCYSAIAGISNANVVVEHLWLGGSLALPDRGRFAGSKALEHLERHWENSAACESVEGITLVKCANPEIEVTRAAREIVAFVRNGNRYRDCAVLLRSMEGYEDLIRRIFARYGIPIFLDRRESISHHALAELTRCALQMVAGGWRHDDWFGALKTGLVWDDEEAIDRLENEALARGWKGDVWFSPLRIKGEVAVYFDNLRKKLLPAFEELRDNLGGGALTGQELAEAVRTLWADLRVEEKLQKWEHAEQHATVWQQMVSWMEDVELAFAEQKMELREWLPILEAGLSGLTIGVIPPALDQVVVGTIDRSRNPELKLAIVLGLNEGVFPASPASSRLLTETDREVLGNEGLLCGRNTRELLGRERFYGYIACTRSRERLLLTWSECDSQDDLLNPSPFLGMVQRLFPKLEVEKAGHDGWANVEHACELATVLVGATESERALPLFQLPAFASLQRQLRFFRANEVIHDVPTAVAKSLYGDALTTSVSRLEQFAACAFRFFVDSGLGAEERRRFELDVREKGSFQHAVLATFHEQLKEEKKTWHSISPDEARKRIGQIGNQLAKTFGDGLLQSDAASRFSAQAMIVSLQEFVTAIVGWMKQYSFEPEAVELRFDSNKGVLPSWELPLENGHSLLFRGVIDRIDLLPKDAKTAYAVIIDYKSSERTLDDVLMKNGLQLQLLAYLSVLRRLPQAAQKFGFEALIPAGVFYVNLRGKYKGGNTRTDVLEDGSAAVYRHAGRFDFDLLDLFDSTGANKGTQFNYALTSTGKLNGRCKEPMGRDAFAKLLDDVEANLTRMGRSIYEGEIKPNPYQKKKDRACDDCEYQGICRIDPWTHQFRVLE